MAAWEAEIRRDRSVFDELGPWWNQCPGPRSTPFLRSEWFQIWSDSFLPNGSQLEVVLWKKDGEVMAVLPLSRNGLRRSALANSHTDVFDVVASSISDIAPVVQRWLRHRPVTRLFRLDAGSLLSPAQPDPNWLVDRRMEAPYIGLDNGIEGVMDGLSRNLVKDLRRLERRLDEIGDVVYVDNADDVLPDALEQCMKLEASGWKGYEGTAMLSRPDSARFYRELVDIARERGWLRICALLVAGRMAAFELDLDYDGKRFSLKAGYDEYWSRQSPGKVLQLRVLEAAVSAGLSSYEFGGVVEPWKLEWTKTLRPRLNVLTFADHGANRPLGMALRASASRRWSARSSDEPATEE